MFFSRFLPCPDCGASVDRLAAVPHRCDRERVIDTRLHAMRADIDGFENQLQAYLDTPRGSFEAWLAARAVRGEQAR